MRLRAHTLTVQQGCHYRPTVLHTWPSHVTHDAACTSHPPLSLSFSSAHDCLVSLTPPPTHLPIRKLIVLLQGAAAHASRHLLLIVQCHVRQLLLDVTDNLTLCGSGEAVAALCRQHGRLLLGRVSIAAGQTLTTNVHGHVFMHWQQMAAAATMCCCCCCCCCSHSVYGTLFFCCSRKQSPLTALPYGVHWVRCAH
jgi:hypothetical protein